MTTFNPVEEFPTEFLTYLREHQVDPLLYARALDGSLPRFVRANPRAVPAVSLRELTRAYGDDAEVRATCVPGFYAMKGGVGVASSEPYKKQRVYGMDLASGVSVLALGLAPGDDVDVLDLCCAPGGKLFMAADCLYDAESGKVRGTLAGVDISRQRLNVCRKQMRRYKVMGVRLYQADGCSFDVGADRSPLYHCKIINVANRKRKHAEMEEESSSVASAAAAASAAGPPAKVLYSHVLVDAQCTHDGSLKHVVKWRSNWGPLVDTLYNADKVAELQTLQRGLISNGFRLLRPGGVLVYSTCSFSRAQNEDVVQWLLDQHQGDAYVESLEAVPGLDAAHIPPYTAGSLEHTARFTPDVSGTSGALFVARVRKRAVQ